MRASPQESDISTIRIAGWWRDPPKELADSQPGKSKDFSPIGLFRGAAVPATLTFKEDGWFDTGGDPIAEDIPYEYDQVDREAEDSPIRKAWREANVASKVRDIEQRSAEFFSENANRTFEEAYLDLSNRENLNDLSLSLFGLTIQRVMAARVGCVAILALLFALLVEVLEIRRLKQLNGKNDFGDDGMWAALFPGWLSLFATAVTIALLPAVSVYMISLRSNELAGYASLLGSCGPYSRHCYCLHCRPTEAPLKAW